MYTQTYRITFVAASRGLSSCSKTSLALFFSRSHCWGTKSCQCMCLLNTCCWGLTKTRRWCWAWRTADNPNRFGFIWLMAICWYILCVRVFEPPDSIIGPIFDPPSKHVDREVHWKANAHFLLCRRRYGCDRGRRFPYDFKADDGTLWCFYAKSSVFLSALTYLPDLSIQSNNLNRHADIRDAILTLVGAVREQ